MKNKASDLWKQIMTALSSMAKSKTVALKTKTNSIKTRIIIFSLLRNKNTMDLTSINHKLQALLGHHNHADSDDNNDEQSKAIVLHDNAMTRTETVDNYPDLTQYLFGSEDVEMGGSVIDLVKKSKLQEGEEFKLEDEIDQVADLFIRRFHTQMKMQKQQSLKRYQEMLEKSA